MAFATINKPNTQFNTVLWTGNDSTQNITGVGFQPDLWWNKSRSGTHSAGVHCLYDSVRGTTKRLKSNSTDAEATISGVTAFNADGVTLGSENQSNGGSTEYVAWNWKANGAGVSNTAGSITSTVSANTTSGFSIVSYTGNGTSGATIGHGLGAVPKMIIVKNRNGTNQWLVYHASLGATKYLILETTGGAGTASTLWNDTTPTTSLFTVGNSSSVNGSTLTYIAYCFAEVKGFSKFGSYTGNGSTDGPFIYTGFKPAFVLFKASSAAYNWHMFDSKRNTYNVVTADLLPNSSNADNTSNNLLDFVSNGFKLRTGDAGWNDANTYIYMAFAEQPLVGTNNVPATAR